MPEWAKLKVVDLKAELKRRGLPQNGLKTELVARLDEADQGAGGDAQPDEVDESPTSNGDVVAQVTKYDDNKDEVIKDAPAEEPAPPEVTESDPTEPEAARVESKTESESETKLEPASELLNESSELQPPPTIQEAEPAQPEQTTPVPPSSHTETNGTSKEATQQSAEAQKRKRRSASPPPREDDLARNKRARPSDDLFSKPAPIQKDAGVQDMDVDLDRHVEPSIHPATSALCITNLMRPLRPADLRAHIVSLATSPGASASDDVVTKFYLDAIRTHAFVALDSTSAASRVRQLLHGRVWPSESNRKALAIDFIPPQDIDSWIELEEAGGARRPGTRWEVVYNPSPDGSTIEATLVSTSLSDPSSTRPPLPPPSAPANSKPPPSMLSEGVNSAPLGPRGHFSEHAPPTGPRGNYGTNHQPRPAATYDATPPPGDETFTRARPVIAYTLVPEHLAHRRINNMRSFYTRDVTRDLGREFNRYSFEDAESFVDRGREIFEGIRPPHRERGARGRGRGRGLGGPRRGDMGSYRPRSDRYIPSGEHEDRRRY